MSVNNQIGNLKTWQNTGEVLFGSDLNSNFSEIRDRFNAHSHTEFPQKTAAEQIAASWTFAKMGMATASVQHPSFDLVFQASSWDTDLSAESVNRFRLRNVGMSGSGPSYRFALVNEAGTEVLSVRENGNVGIGETAPAEKLVVNGNAVINGELHANGGSVVLETRQVVAGLGLQGGGNLSGDVTLTIKPIDFVTISNSGPGATVPPAGTGAIWARWTS